MEQSNPLRGGNIRRTTTGWWGRFKTALGETVEAAGKTIAELFQQAADKANKNNNQ